MTSATPMTRLRDVAALNPPLGVTPADDEIVSFLPMAAVDAGRLNAVDTQTRQFQEVKKGYTPFLPDDVLVAKITPCFENGKVAQAKPTRRVGFGSTEFHVIRSRAETLDPRYLVHFLRQERVRRAGEQKMTGSAGQRRIPEHFLANLQIPLPPFDEQERIAAILDKADALRAKRRAALAKLDELTQSIFLDLFGDPRTNPKGFPVRTLTEFYTSPDEGTKCGPFGSALKKYEFVSDGVPVWNMDNIGNRGRIILPCRMWITAQKFRQLQSYAIRDGDVIISRAGTVGKMCVVSAGYPKSIISTNLIRVRFGRDLLPLYFVSLMTYCKGRVGRLRTGPDGAFTHMSTSILDTLRFPYPPLELQKRFSKTVNSIEVQMPAFDTQLAELERLFASLQQRAFRGEL